MSKKREQGKKLLPAGLIALAVLAADRLGKRWAAAALAPDGSAEAIRGILGWRYAENTGVAFSFLAGSGPAVCVLTALIIAAALLWLLRHPRCGAWMRVGLTLLIAGGLGNLYDRVMYGFVIDFIEALFVRFAVFNVADVAVVSGVICLMIGVLKSEGKARGSLSDRR